MARVPKLGSRSKVIDKTLFGFIWRYSKRQQIVLLLVTLALFPFLYLTLELPKRIINDAIGAGQPEVDVLGMTFSQIGFLWLLCAAFLISVLAHGLLKMRINTMKGVLAERMLRRFRYQLVTRLFRFPKPFFQRTSQAEIVSMVTAEAEPLGGMMGDAISQPILQAGQMLTILAFLFFQSFWFGLAAVALIPLQAYIIPILQRQINKLNKKRIREVRVLASEIGETAAGATDLRTSGGHPYRAAQITHRLGRLFGIRLQIYRKKFFMKFLNNFITQLTPFFFFSIGGYLVIQGSVSLGALVAALAAYKDLSSPWKELLTYYNQFHEMAQRWRLITDTFAPTGMLDEKLVEGRPDRLAHLRGDIRFENVAARDDDGLPVLEGIDLTLPAGSTVGIAAASAEERRAFTELLARELMPSEGRITIGGKPLTTFHQAEIGARVGVADASPYVFAGTIGDNVVLPLKTGQVAQDQTAQEVQEALREAERAGNAGRLLEGVWIDPGHLGLTDEAAVWTWWLSLEEGIGAGPQTIQRALGLVVRATDAPRLAAEVVRLRAEVRARLKGDGLAPAVHPFDRTAYHPDLTLMQNLLFAVPFEPVTQEGLARHADFLPMLRALSLEAEVFDAAQAVVELLHTTFGADGTDHPLFQRLGIRTIVFEETLKISQRAVSGGRQALDEEDLALLLALPCVIAPRHVGQGLPETFKAQVVAKRAAAARWLKGSLASWYQPLDADSYADGLSVLENAVFGLVNRGAGSRADMAAATVAAVITEHDLKTDMAFLTLNAETLLGGSNLPTAVRERISLIRAAIKKPDVVVLNQAMASHEADQRQTALDHLRAVLPEATIIHLEPALANPEAYDLAITLEQGRVTSGGDARQMAEPQDTHGSAPDLPRKLQAIKQTVFFSGVDQRQLRLLAFSAETFEAPAGDIIFHHGDDPSTGVFLIQKGEADFYLPLEGGGIKQIRTAGPGSLVGELALILGEPRTLTMQARSDVSGLRIGSEEFLSVIRNDAATSFKFLQLIAGYVSNAPDPPPPD